VVKFAAAAERLYEILIWNWKTGVLLNRIACDNGICDFVFLDNDSLVLWFISSGSGNDLLDSASLLVYENICSTETKHNGSGGELLDVSSFLKRSPTLAFQFPQLRRESGVSSQGFLIRSDPGPGRNYTTSAPFSSARALTLGLAMSVLASGHLRHFRIFVDVHQLLGHLEQAKQQSTSALNWDEWGDDATRWFPTARAPTHWICWMFGSRFITRDAPRNTSDGRNISVFDFHSPTIRRHSTRIQDTYVTLKRSPARLLQRKERIRIGDLGHFDHNSWPDELGDAAVSENAVAVDVIGRETPTIIPYFQQPITSRLPYRVVTPVHSMDAHEGWLIDGNHIIGMDVGTNRFSVSITD
jgi:hypothetical protein